MKATILAIGKCKHGSPEAEIIAEYTKRSGWDLQIKEKDNSTPEDEAKFLQSNIPHGAKVVVLGIEIEADVKADRSYLFKKYISSDKAVMR